MSFIDTITSGDYMPHGHCFLWREDLLLMHVGGDLATAAAYFAIPAALVKLVRQRTDLAFNWIFLMFALFIFLCGVTHVIDSINIWHGYYHIEGVAKVATAIVSLVTAVMAWRLLPTALAIPSHQDLLAKNQQLRAMQQELEAANRELESKVAARTEELRLLASRDDLTGLSNRRELIAVLDRELARAKRYGHALTVAMVDVDDFKLLNDRLGHQAGDQVLQAIARTFEAGCRTSDIVGRYGGEEFLVVMPETGSEAAALLANRLLDSLRQQAIAVNGDRIATTCSIGIASARQGELVEDLVDRADKAMYAAKDAGKDRTVVAD